MATGSDGSGDRAAVLIFENDPRQAIAYRELFAVAGDEAETALPDQDIPQLLTRLKPDAVLADMGIWEADTAYIFGVLYGTIGVPRPVIVALCTLPHQVRRENIVLEESVGQ